MNLQLGIYEIFSTIIPGMIYMAAIIEFLRALKILRLDWTAIDDLPLVVSLGLLLVAYLLGMAFSRLGIAWYEILNRKDQSLDTLTRFKERHKNHWTIDLDDKDWPILLAYIRSRSIELAREIERHLATAIMLRNGSLGMFLLALIVGGEYILAQSLVGVIVGLALLFLSLLMLRESVKFRGWYYDTILSTIIAYRIDLERTIQPVEAGRKTGSVKKKV